MYKAFTRSPRCRSLKVPRSFVLAVASAVTLIFVSDNGWGQQRAHSTHRAQRATTVAPSEQEKPAIAVATPAPVVDPSTALGQALAACDTLSAGSFILPGLKGEVTLDRCYKGRDRLVCVFNAVISEAKSLMDSYTKIVDAKYPELNSVESICKLKRDVLATDITGADDFTKRFAVLKSEYEAGAKCAANVKQGFRDVVLTDMAQPPEILKSMNDLIDADINRVSQVENQAVELAGKMQAAAKAMRTVDKIHRTMCFKESTESTAPKQNTESSAPKENTESSAPKDKKD